MSALTGPRTTGSIRYIDRDFRPMAAGSKIYPGALVVAVASGANQGYYQQGQAGACVSAGKATGLGGSATQGGISTAGSSSLTGGVVDNTNGANGALYVQVEYIDPFYVMLFNNDTVNPVLVASRENQVCWVLDDQTVTATSAGNGVAGEVYDVTTEGVWVKVAKGVPNVNAGVPIQTGTLTLVAGTVTLATGINVNAGSVVLLSRKTQHGTLTSTVMYEEIGADRVTGAPGTGSITVQASTSAGAVATADTSVLQYAIIG